MNNKNIVYYTIIPKNYFLNKNETEAARELLKRMLKELNLEEKEIILSNNGKPYFKDSNLFFNYSHSKNYIACAIGYEEVGIDIEETTRKISDCVSKKYLDNQEGNNNRIIIWVKKESYSKLKGLGLQMNYKDVNIDQIKEKNKLIQNKNYICSIYSDSKNVKFQEIWIK